MEIYSGSSNGVSASREVFWPVFVLYVYDATEKGNIKVVIGVVIYATECQQKTTNWVVGMWGT